MANKVANKVANKTKHHRRHRVYKKNKKRATKKHLRGGELVGINPFFYGDEKCELCEIAEKERGMAHYLKDQIEDFLTKQKEYYSDNKYNITKNEESVSDFIDNLKIGDNIDESDQMKDYFYNFMDSQDKNKSLNEILENFVKQYDEQSSYCESETCKKTLPPPPLPPRRQRRQRQPPPIDLCNPDYNVNVKGREDNICICKYGSEYNENAGTCLCKEGFEKNNRGYCIQRVPEGVYGVIPGLQKTQSSRLSSKPRGDCSKYGNEQTCYEQSHKCGWTGKTCEELYPYPQITQPDMNENPYAAWSRKYNKWGPENND